MAETDDPVDAAARLEGALERIALMAEQMANARHAHTEAGGTLNAPLVARRLDSLIAKLRSELESPST